jgi:hypothetical protein
VLFDIYITNQRTRETQGFMAVDVCCAEHALDFAHARAREGNLAVPDSDVKIEVTENKEPPTQLSPVILIVGTNGKELTMQVPLAAREAMLAFVRAKVAEELQHVIPKIDRVVFLQDECPHMDIDFQHGKCADCDKKW